MLGRQTPPRYNNRRTPDQRNQHTTAQPSPQSKTTVGILETKSWFYHQHYGPTGVTITLDNTSGTSLPTLCQHPDTNSTINTTTNNNINITNNKLLIVTRKYERRGVMQSLKNLHWLPIKWRIDYKIAVTTYKLITTRQPQYLCSRIEHYSHTLRRSLRNVDATHNSLRLVVPAIRTVIETRAFRSPASDIWNKLPDDIVKSPSLLSLRN